MPIPNKYSPCFEAKLDPRDVAAAILAQQKVLGATSFSDQSFLPELQELQAKVLTSDHCTKQDREIFHFKDLNRLSKGCRDGVYPFISELKRVNFERFNKINQEIASSIPGLKWDTRGEFHLRTKSGLLVFDPYLGLSEDLSRFSLKLESRFDSRSFDEFRFDSHIDQKSGLPVHIYNRPTYDTIETFLAKKYGFPVGFDVGRCGKQ